MGGIGNCCCDPCVLPGCSSFTLPIGSVSIKFKTTGGTHELPEQTIAAAFATSIACCTEASNSLNVLVIGDTFTREYVINDQADTRSWRCFPDLSFFKTADYSYEVRREGASAVRVDYRYCNLQVSTCAAVKMIYGVPVCGIQVTVTLQRKGGSQSIGVGWDAFKGTATFYDSSGGVISVHNDWQLCFPPLTTIAAWPASPTIPTVSPIVRTCADTFLDACVVTRSVFVPSVTSLPPGTVVLLTAADTTTDSPAGCSTGGVSIFNPCAIATVPRWITTLDACGNPTFTGSGVTPPFIWDTNFGFICDPDTTGGCGPSGPDLVSRTRTQAESISHPRGSYIVNLPAQTWTLTF